MFNNRYILFCWWWRRLKKLKNDLTFFEGLLVGFIIFTIFLISQYGFNFLFISKNSLPFSFSECFRPMTLLLLALGILITYHYCANKNSIESILIGAVIWCYYDLAFLSTNPLCRILINRDIYMFTISIFLLAIYSQGKTIFFNLKILLSLMLLLPFECLILANFSATSTSWYITQYNNLDYAIKDILLKTLPFIVIMLSTKIHKSHS